MTKPHKKLVAWQKCMSLVELIYRLTKSFPKEETFGLVSQMRRSAVSAPSNIAEGAAGRSKSQFSNLLGVALGSLNELDTQVEISRRVGYLSDSDFFEATRRIDECIAVTYGLKKSISN